MLEFYQAYSDYQDLMNLTEEMLQTVVQAVTGGLEVQFSGNSIDFSKFVRYSMIEAIQKFWKEETVPSTKDLCRHDQVGALLQRAGLDFKADLNWGKLVELLFEHVVEEHLIQPTFIYDFPTELSPLSKTKAEDSRFA